MPLKPEYFRTSRANDQATEGLDGVIEVHLRRFADDLRTKGETTFALHPSTDRKVIDAVMKSYRSLGWTVDHIGDSLRFRVNPSTKP